jgi:hypothetical protein
MNKFILLKARNEALYRRAYDRLRERAFSLLAINPSRIRVREFPEANVLMANFELADSGGFHRNHVYTGEDRSTAFDGLPYFHGVDPSKNWAQQVDAVWRDDESALNGLYGTWALARYDVREGGRSLGDFSGMSPLFYWSDADYLAVSPRQMLLAGVCGEMQFDPEVMAWLVGQANIIGDRMPVRGVRHLPPQHTLSFSPRPGDITPRFTEREIWGAGIDESSDPVILGEICDSMIDQMESLARLPLPPLRVDVTGGLDSRLVVALADRSSLRDRIETLQTHGPENGYDIQVGRTVAEAVGLPHVARVSGPNQSHPEGMLKLVRSNAFRYEGSLCLADGLIGFAGTSRTVLTGSAGEIYRRHCKPHMKVVVEDERQLRELFADYHQKTDPLGVEKPHVVESQRRTMQDLAVGYHRAGADLNDVTDVFFMRYRLPLWNGVMMGNIYSSARIYPLVNLATARYAFSRGFRARVTDRIHFELLLRVNPKLCAMPFLGFAWPEAYRKMAADAGVHVATEPFPVVGKQSLGQANHLTVMVTDGWDLARQYLLDRPNSPIWDVLDRERVEDLFERRPDQGQLGVVGAKQMFSLLGMQAALSGDLVPGREGTERKPSLDGAHAVRMFGVAAGAGA